MKPRNLDLDCPACGAREVFRSRARTRLERAIRMTRVLSYCRCHRCGWRGRRLFVAKQVIIAVLLALFSFLILFVFVGSPL